MSRHKFKRTSKKQDNQPVKQESGLIEEQMENLNYRALMIFSTVGAACAILGLLFFFNSDVGSKIITAKTTPVVAAQSSTPNQPGVLGASEGSGSTDLVAVLNDPEVSREVLVAHLTHMSDEEFQRFIDTVTIQTAGTNVSGANDALIELLQDERSKSAIITYLNELDKAEFDALIRAILTAVGADSEQETDSMFLNTEDPQETLQKTLEDAYAEAVRMYPGQIDGSKRLKLIDDLNATSYMYYVAEEGDTLIKLSHAFHVPLGQLVELNGIHDADVIPAGMVLLFPSDTVQPDIRK